MCKRCVALVILGASLACLGAGADLLPYVPSWTPPDLDAVRTRLDGLSWSDFVETSYRLYLQRFPEAITRMGMAADLGVRDDRLNDYSDAYVRETMEIESEILARLRAYDRSALSLSDQTVYDACAWYWDDLVRAHPFLYYDYPVSHLFVTSADQLTQELLLEIHPLSSAADAENYVLRLEQLGAQLDGIIDALDRRAAVGVVVPQRSLDWALPGVRQMAAVAPADCPYLVRLQSALPELSDLEPGDADALVRRAGAAAANVIVPAYRRLAAHLAALRASAPEMGIGRVAGGAEYYDYLLRHFTGLDLSAADVHEMGLREVARVQAEVRAAATALGYPAEALPIAELFSRASSDGGYLADADILAEYDRLIAAAKVDSLEFLSVLPATDVVVEQDPYGGFYRSAPRDGSRPAAFGAQTAGTLPRFTMPTLAYHETIPGHHVQIALAQEMDLPLVLRETTFLGFTEGWALYAERLAWEHGWYANDAYGNLGRLQFELMRAARMVVDTGLHALGWTYADAMDYYQKATGRSMQLAQSDVYRYAVWPGQAVSYGVGFAVLLDLRARAEEALGDAFDLTAFHDMLLAGGNVPLGMVVAWVDAYVADVSGPLDAEASMP